MAKSIIPRIINISNVLNAFRDSIRVYRLLFYVLPIVVGVILPWVLFSKNDEAISTFNSFLTSFVPLFATILTFYLSWCYNKIQTRHNGDRLKLFRETSTNILMMIPLDVLALLFAVLTQINWFDSCHLFSFSEDNSSVLQFFNQFTVRQLIKYLFLVGYYSCITEIVLIVLMVCKRAFVIINNEITLLSEEENQQE